MPTSFSIADEKVTDAVERMMSANHQPLHAAGVKVGVLVAYNPDGPAVRHGGYAARATIRVVPLKDRLTKGYDAELLLDQAELDLMRVEHLNALVDHELTHLELAMKKVKPAKGSKAPPDYVLARDDLGRPKLKTRLGDWSAGDGFREVVQRHGDYAPEYENIMRAKSAADAAKAEGEKGEAA